MVASTSLATSENFDHLVEEIRAIVSESRDLVTIEMIAMKYCIGEAIATHELYRKHGKNQSQLYDAIAEQVNMQSKTLAECVKLYETYPDEKPKSIAEQLYTEHGAWRNVRKALYGDVSDAAETTDRKCKHCPIHC